VPSRLLFERKNQAQPLPIGGKEEGHLEGAFYLYHKKKLDSRLNQMGATTTRDVSSEPDVRKPRVLQPAAR
jgi:hypothetical protein